MSEFNFENDRTDIWCGSVRHIFTFQGEEARIIEPAEPNPRAAVTKFNQAPAGPKKWVWIPEWPDAFPNRNGIQELLELGYYVVHIHVYGTFCSGKGSKLMYDFYRYFRTLGFAEKGAFIGMSLGGLYSFRFLSEHPETAACVYADAPVCDLNFHVFSGRSSSDIAEAYGLADPAKLKDHPLSPVNNYMPLIKAGIPVLMLLGMSDDVVNPPENGELFAERYAAAGGRIIVARRPAWGHHPHGSDYPLHLVKFILQYTWNV